MKNLYFLFDGYLREERTSHGYEVDSIKSIKIIVGNGTWKNLYELIEMTLMMFLEDASSERKE